MQLRHDKIVLLGDSSVGKTSTIEKFLHGTIPKFCSSTVGAGYSELLLDYHNSKRKVQIWDTAGQEKSRSMVPIYARNATGAFVVFSLDNKESFKNIPKWISSLKTDAKIVIVGNKCDLPMREVSRRDALELASKYNAEYIETSSLTGEGITDLFTSMVSSIIDYGENHSPETSISSLEIENKRGSCW
ncbi:small GTP-binding protein, putative [Trichomonas vaginalis G3]|uniref:Small GTP-binding protein, putative n=1 Tax=Trichomonas vaginalis (strain ATCC PRA-98 / G3) TaxID=412133 RepID=A2E619_TRIV3|nr:GTPase protein [Trichomonas vaginalis G3]EAY11861.1 small GTP-binding protein, putative [Trichomonas vaginalis G3]KAI5532271.1 GTPase protein [Trichomonas vaginalis G3]|eukprot:XP_001324084.1 small GTP-binding protein [Trichomonas vaginalis G3]